VDWAEVAIECGYCDQAHMAHEFREFSGISPGSYSAQQHMWRNHVAVD
jgi:AraC-like DNA-binding protein